jgi:hypothetical protein
MSNTTSDPDRPYDRRTAENTALARLRQSTWEATQFISFDEIRALVEDVLHEVETDEP